MDLIGPLLADGLAWAAAVAGLALVAAFAAGVVVGRRW
jgi:hypothetical protein